MTANVLATLESRYLAEYTAWFNSMTPSEQAAELLVRQQTREPLELAFQVGPSGTLHSLSAFRMRIPVIGTTSQSAPSNAALGFLVEIAPALGVASTSVVGATKVRGTPDGGHIVEYAQERQTLPVWRAGATVVLDSENRVTAFGATVAPDAVFDDTPETKSPSQAVSQVSQTHPSAPVAVELGYFYAPAVSEPGVEGPAVDSAVRAYSVELASGIIVYVSAGPGGVLGTRSLRAHDRHLEVLSDTSLQYDDICHASGDSTCPQGWCSTGVCENPNPWPGSSSGAAFGAGLVFNYGESVLGWSGCDNTGYLKIVADDYVTEACGAYGTAQQLIFGQDLSCMSVIGHEFAHCSEANNTNAASDGEEGAADVLGQYAYRMMTGSTSWTHGEGPGCELCDNGTNVWTPGSGRRSKLHDPEGFDYGDGPQPSNWADYFFGTGYHNQTILGHAGFLMGREPTDGPHMSWGISVTGIGPASASQVWFQALTSCVPNQGNFTDWRNCLVTKGCALGSTECVETVAALDAVGLWRGNFGTGWAVQDQVGTTRRVLSGTAKEHVFYRKQGSSSVFWRSRLEQCSLGCFWSAEAGLSLQAASAPQAATLSGVGGIVVCAQQPSSAIGCRYISAAGAVENIGGPIGPTDGRVALVALDAYNVMLAWRDSGSGQVKFQKYHRARTSSWSAIVSTPAVASTGPALASGFDEEFSNPSNGVWLVVRRPSNGTIGYYEYDGSNFGSELLAGRSDEVLTTSGVSAAMYRGRLHVAGHLAHNGKAYVAACGMPCSNAANWTRWVPQHWSSYVWTPQLDGRSSLKAYFTDPATLSLAYRFKRSE